MASNLKGLGSKMAEALNCPSCFLLYDQQSRLPKVFPCHHTVCLCCANQLCQRQGGGPEFLCPKCQHPVIIPPQGASGLQTNPDVNNMVEIMAQGAKEPVCLKHPTAFVTNLCMVCKVGMCPECIASSAMQDHSDHNDEVLELGDAFKKLRERVETLNTKGKYIQKLMREKGFAIKRLTKSARAACINKSLRVFGEIEKLSEVIHSAEFTDVVYTMKPGIGEGELFDGNCNAAARKQASGCIQDVMVALNNSSKAMHETIMCTKLSAVACQTDLLRLKLSCESFGGLDQIFNNLWHLVEESLPCCHRLVMLGGVDLLISCLSDTESELKILKPLLEIFGSMSEHQILHKHILTTQVVYKLVSVLHKFSMSDDHVPERSCRILAHFLSNGSVTWPLDCLSRDGTSELVKDTCMKFASPLNFQVASFRPHLLLMSQQVSQAAKYWAMWWLDQCTLKHPKRYAKILVPLGAVPVLENQTQSDEYVRAKCDVVLQSIQQLEPSTSSVCVLM